MYTRSPSLNLLDWKWVEYSEKAMAEPLTCLQIEHEGNTSRAIHLLDFRLGGHPLVTVSRAIDCVGNDTNSII